jgi:hypothetical protein
MAQRPAPPRHREKLRCAPDERARNRCACRSCHAVSPCTEDALDDSSGRRVVRVLDASLRRRMIARSARQPTRGRPAAVAAARVRRTCRPRALPAPHERSRIRQTALRARPRAWRLRPLPSSKQQSRPALLLVVHLDGLGTDHRDARSRRKPVAPHARSVDRHPGDLGGQRARRAERARVGAPRDAAGYLVNLKSAVW